MPDQSGTKPVIALKIVDFPDPLSPTRPKDWPDSTYRDASITASTRLAPAPNQTFSFSIFRLLIIRSLHSQRRAMLDLVSTLQGVCLVGPTVEGSLIILWYRDAWRCVARLQDMFQQLVQHT